MVVALEMVSLLNDASRELVPPEQRSQAFGAFHFVVGMGMLTASLLSGWCGRFGGQKLLS